MAATPTELEQSFLDVGSTLGLVDAAHGDQAVAVAAQIRKRGAYADVRTVLVGRRTLKPEQADQILSKMPTVNQRCPVCGNEFMGDDFDPEALCPRDGAPLRPQLAPLEAGKTVRPVSRPNPSLPPPPPPPSQQPRRAFGKERDTASKDPMVGKQFGNFKLLHLISSSHTSNVYEARLGSGDLPFAVKVLRSTDDTRRRRFLREAKLAALIGHPNVIDIIEVGEAAEHLYLAMEYVQGHNLMTVIEATNDGNGMPPGEAIPIALAILDGLEAAHQLGIVHRDLKPHNIIVGTLDVKIADFGSARQMDDAAVSGMLTANNVTVGTAAYMAPEQLQTPKVDYRADLYAFGATLYHMLTGKLPFDGKNAMDVAMAKMREPAPSLRSKKKDVPAAIDEAVLKLLERDPEQRTQSAALAARALTKAMN